MTRRGNLRYRISCLLILLMVGQTLWLKADDRTNVPRISVDQLKKRLSLSDTVIIDVRKPRNWWRTSKKILGAMREDPSKADQWAPKYSKNQTLVFY